MLLADIILIIHFLFVLFVVGSVPAIWIGARLGWRFVRNIRFRLVHLGAILFVSLESLAGMVCPLTLLEDSLRRTPADTSFIQRWLHRILFYDVPEGVLTVLYVMFAILVAVTFKFVPPSRYRRAG
ncbi:MAG: putative membrane protein [Nitrosospira sp.]